MNNPRPLGPTAAGFLVVGLFVTGLASRAIATDTPPKPIVLYRADGTATDTLKWTTSRGEQSVLEAVGDDEERWLILTAPDGSRIRLGGPRTHPLGNFGREFELRDDSTGWWIRYSLTTPGFTPPQPTADMTFDEVLDRIRQAQKESGAETRVEIWTSDGIVVRRSTADGPWLYSEIAEELRDKGLRGGFPKAAERATKYLVEMRKRNQLSDRHWDREFNFLVLLVDALSDPKADERDSS